MRRGLHARRVRRRDGEPPRGGSLDDGGTAACDGCSATCQVEAPSRCGDGVVDVTCGEECDDGNDADGDCCSTTCRFEPTGTPCGDGRPCNGDETCDGSGTCAPGSAPACDDGNPCTQDGCDDPSGCVHRGEPRALCRQADRARFALRRRADDRHSQLEWQWIEGETTTESDLGDPTAETSYALCIYDTRGGAATLAGLVGVGPRPDTWTDRGSGGWLYHDRTGSQDGVTRLRLQPGADGEAGIALRVAAPPPFRYR